MLTVHPLTRAEIDRWPVADSGLPARVVNSTETAGISTIGELRRWDDADLLRLRSLGRVSITHIHYFFRLCERIERGEQRFQTIQEIIDIFLDKAEQSVLFARYGFDRALMEAARNCVTLQELGNVQHRTRERIRQVEESAKEQLGSRLAKVCLAPFYAYARDRISAKGGIAACDELYPLSHEITLGGHNPCGVLLLLHDLYPMELTFHEGLFSVLPAEKLADLSRQATRVLADTDKALTAEELASELSGACGGSSVSEREKVMVSLMTNASGVTATMSGRFFDTNRGTGGFLMEVMGSMQRPAHYRTVTAHFNEMVHPRHRRGAGHVLDLLNQSAECVRVDRGVYDLR